ncbi:glutamate--tRNA ligase [Sphingosinicella sp. BN140058]|uniref:glutamate--tRNA ligase n=1 Tax=Sphingosinicella sp. BN140058 TaxID=1892855 RepID=UPI0010109105|nr:glutamate--tRNA ligase [Sphingosinicella sp. BN140058]QAY76948.1 glutamate--tRNA ligase [Sphingosinicella sp. BN140058]
MNVVTRFAPAPTGRLHVGNIRTAIHNWLWARKHQGRFLLRFDDTDRERSTEDSVHAIRADLAWLGLQPDEEHRQSARFDRYDAALEQLRAAGRVYPAYETAQELDLKRKVQLSRGKPPVYDRAALSLTEEERARLEAEGRRPHWRFRLDHGAPIAWTDMIRGPQHFDPALLSDPVIRREDGSWLYMLPSTIDDIDMDVTHVVRGEDHVTNTALQIQMFEALGATPPDFAHEALLVGSEGKLSKRLGSLGVDAMREDGIESAAILAKLARLGTSLPVEAIVDPAPLIETFDFATFGRAPARFDLDELKALNARIIHLLPFAAIADRLPEGMGEEDWAAIRPNLKSIAEAADWWSILHGHVEAIAEEQERPFLQAAAVAAGALDWAEAPWPQLVAALKAETGRTGKTLFLPLRRALTGRDSGPEMAALLPLIGRDETIARLSAAAGA